MIKIATWNVNSLRVRLGHVLQWLDEVKPDVLALQETKLIDEDFPLEAIRNAGYECIYSGQKTYNGVAVLSKKNHSNSVREFPNLADPQRRILGITIDDLRILNVYIPNGQSVGSDKYAYKLNWLKQLDLFLQDEIKNHSHYVVLGDFNIAPEEVDVHDPLLWEGQVLVSPPERTAFRNLIELGFQDCFRLHEQPEKSFSWWDYRMNAFRRNMGMRIDHILASSALAGRCHRCYIDKTPRSWERPTDHAPVVAEFEL